MSQTIDNRIVEMQFDNKQFESGVSESLSTLDKLKQALKFDDASKNLDNFGKNVSKNIDLSGLSKSVEDLNSKFSLSGIAGIEAIRKLTDFAIEAGKTIANALDAPFKQIREGGWKRAMNIEDAKFQLKGLDITWESVADDINYAVQDTAFGLDAAAKACSQLSASGVQAGDAMKAALRGISGVAAMGNTEYENIADIFTKAAGNGKVMAMELNRVSQYGLNARASLSKFFNAINEGDESVADIPENVKKRVKAITDGVKVTEADISEFASKSKIDFQTFSYAMDNAFGEHAKKANETFMGSLRNIKAALSKIGAEFATPIIKGAIPIFNEIRIFLNDLRKQMGPVFDLFKRFTEVVSERVVNKLQRFRNAFLNEWDGTAHIWNSLKNIAEALITVFTGIKVAFDEVFPPVKNLGRSVNEVTKGMESFTKKLIMSESTLIGFKNIMVIIFNVIKLVGTAIKSIIPIVGKVITIAGRIAGVILSVIGYITQLIFKLDIVQNTMDGIRKAGGLFAYAIEKVKDAFYYLKDILSDTSTVTGQVFAKIKDAAIMVAYVVGGSLYLAFMKLKELFSYFDAHDPLGSLLEGINKLKSLPIIKDIVGGIEKAFITITDVISKAIKLFTDFLNNIKNGKSVIEVLGIAASTVFGGILTIIGKLGDAVKSFFGIFQRDRIIEESIEMPIANAGLAMTGMTKELTKTEGTVKGTATAFDEAKGSITGFVTSAVSKIKDFQASKMILAAYAAMLLVIAFNANELIKSLRGLSSKLSMGIFNMFKTTPTRWEKFSIGIREITISIIALAGAVYLLTQLPTDKLDKVTSSLLKLIGLIGGLSLASTLLTEFLARWGKGKGGFASFATNMLALTAGILALTGALKVLDEVKMTGKELWGKVGVIGALAVGLATLTVIMSKVAPKLTLGSISMITFAASMLILVKALDNLSKVPFENLKDNFLELSVVIVSFGAFAALAGTVGISSILSLATFLLTINVLFKNFDEIKSNLEKNHIGEMIVSFFAKLRDSFKKALEYVLETYDNMSTASKIIIALAGTVGLIAFTVLAVYMHKVEVGIKKTILSIALIAGEIVLLSWAVTKIVESCKNLNSGDIGKCVLIMASVAGLLSIIIGITGWLAGDTTSDSFESAGLFGRKKKVNGKSTKTASASLKQTRKMLLDMGILLASIALFVNTVGKLKPEELAQAESLLWKTMTFIGVIMAVITLITAFSRNTNGAAASAVTFVGVIALLGSILGSFVILMNYFKDYTFDKQGIARIVAALVSLGVIVGAIFGFLKILQSNENGKSTWITVLAFTAMIGAIGYIIVYMTKNIKADEIGTAIALAGTLIGFMVIMGLVVVGLEALSNRLVNTKARRKAFTETIVGVGVMIGSVVAVGMTISKLSSQINTWGDYGKMAAIAGLLIGVLAAIGTMVLALERFAKNTKYTITQKSQKTLIWTLSMIAGFIGAFVLVARVFYQLSGIDAGRMAGQALILTGTLIALAGLAEGILYLVKKMETGWGDLAKAGTILGGMIGIFTILAVIFKYIVNDINTDGLFEKISTINLCILELEALMYIVMKIVKDRGKELAIGEIGLAGMVAIFAVLTKIFKIIDGLKVDSIYAKSNAITLVMLELEALMLGLVGIGKLITSSWITALAGVVAGIGMYGLYKMIEFFEMLAQVFVVIDGLKTEGIMAKSQTIVLVMLELEVLGLLALLSFPAAIGLASGLDDMIEMFGKLAIVFTIIDGLKVEGIMAKSQTIILVLLELEVLGTLSILTLPALVGALGLDAMVEIFGKLAIIFTTIDGLHVEGLLEKAHAVILVLLELEGLSVLSILSVFALAGAPGLDAMVEIFGKLSTIFALLNGLQLEGMAEKAAILIHTIQILTEMGLEGFVNSFGLEDLAEALKQLTDVILELTSYASEFALSITSMSSSMLILLSTGPQLTAWATGVSSSINSLQSTLSSSATAIIRIINNMVNGMAHALSEGRVVIGREAVALGQELEKGISKDLKPKSWGAELVDNFASGIRSALGGVASAAESIAKTVWNYIHFSDGAELSYLKAGNVKKWGYELDGQYGSGITSGLPQIDTAMNGMSSTIANAMTGLKGIGSEGGWDFVTGLVDSLTKGDPAVRARLNKYLEMFGIVKNEYAKLNSEISSSLSSTKQNYVTQLKGELQKEERTLKKLQHGAKSIENDLKIENHKKKIDDLSSSINKLMGITEDTVEPTKDLGDGLSGLGDSGKGAKEGVTEIKDEIADFYDSIEGAISLFQEFNKETELTSDQLIKNMRSQIEGISEWSSQIQKLAFMGIDQGLLKELADMGPQGYEYTNAFVHMTADQLAEANNLYHQSLMLPAKVTSQIYGSFTVAGRSAASGFLMGMDREQIKEHAIGFAHDVVDQMNLALDIQSGKSMVAYQDGVAVINGIKTGISAGNMQTAIKLLTDNDIKGGIDKGLFHPTDHMYTVGKNITEGIANGIENPDAKGKAKKSVENLCGMIIMTAENMFQEKSPSRVFKKIGGFLTQGLAIGITDETQSAVSAMNTTSEEIIDTMRETINKANEALVDGVNEPVITPVLDLSEIQNGSRQLDNMLSRNSAFSAGRSFTDLQNQQWGSQTALLNATMDNTDVVGAIASLSDDINTLKEAMTNIKMVLDTGTMVGAMTPAIDQQLGARQVLAGRGI